MSGPVRVEREGGLAVVTFDSPPLNLFDEPLSAALTEAIGELETSSPRAVLFRAEGRVVSGGWRAVSTGCRARPCSPPTACV